MAKADFRTPRLLGFAFCAATAACLTGCVVDQAKEVRTYREVLDAGRANPKAFRTDETLTLARALELANANNEPLASQGETYLQALIAKNRAFSAFMPTVSFQPNFAVEQAPRGAVPASAPGAPPTSAATAAASQGGFEQHGSTLTRFEAPIVGQMNFSYRDVPLYEAAKIAAAEERQRLLDAQATLLLNVAQTYYQVVISSRQVEVLQHSIQLQKARLANMEGRFKVRLALDLDVAQARSDEAAAQVALDHASNDVRNGRRVLALLIGVPEIDGPLVEATLVPDPVMPADSYVSRALAGRQDLVAAKQAVEEARYAVKAAVAEYYPSVSLNVAAYLYRENYADSSKWNGILSANLPLFTGGAIRADVREAWSRLRQAALFESYLEREIDQGVRTAYDNELTSGVVLSELGREVEAASQAYSQSIQMEKNGLSIPLDVLTAQDALLNAQLQYTAEYFNRTILELDLIRAVGDLDPAAPERLRWADPEPSLSAP